MNKIHTMLIGGLLGIAATLAGLGVARAECYLDRDYTTGVELVDSEPTDYELAFELAEYRCDAWVQGMLEDEGMTEEQLGGHGGMYEACMRLSVPPMVLSPAQHYDTSDGAFWRTVEVQP